MRKPLNSEHIEGRVYEHNLTVKTVQNKESANYGKEFISGTLDVATDEEGLNVLSVHFTYVTETTSKGQKNATYTNLKKIIDGGKTWISAGKDEAIKVKIDTALALKDFYAQDDSLVSVKMNEGGFVTIVNELSDVSERNTFQVDMIITSVTKTEIDEERNIKEPYVTLRGAIFNFKNDLLPLDFVVKNEAGMKYFENLDVSNSEPIYTKVWGKINCATVKIERSEESAFGEAAVKTYEKKTKEWIVTGTAKIPYEFGDEKILTAEELTKAIQNREIYLADKKKANDEWKAQKASASSVTNSTVTNSVAKGNFKF